MTEFHGIELRALWDEVKFDVRHAGQIERCAVVGDRAWEAWMTKLSRPIFFKQNGFYNIAERDKAWEWINDRISNNAQKKSWRRHHRVLLVDCVLPLATLLVLL